MESVPLDYPRDERGRWEPLTAPGKQRIVHSSTAERDPDWFRKWLDNIEQDPDYQRYRRRSARIARLTNWMARVPLVGSVMFVFWNTLLDEGPRGLGPRWGALTFAFMNDGIHPTLWHTWYSVTHDNLAPYSGIYPKGAPRSRLHAELLERQFEAERYNELMLEQFQVKDVSRNVSGNGRHG